MSYGEKLNELSYALRDLLFPRRFCLVCGRGLYEKADLCPECQKEISAYKRCSRCDAFLPEAGDTCQWCQKAPVPFVSCTIALPYQGYTRDMILALKYERALYVARAAGRLLAARIKQRGLDFDLIVAVPLHSLRQKERGYNQAELIARSLAAELKIAYEFRAVARIKNTVAQYGLSSLARQENIKDAFGPGPKVSRVCGRKLLIVDDIISTGATSFNLAKCLLAAGAKELSFAAVSAPIFD